MHSRVKELINRGLQPWNVRVQSLTAERAEKARLSALEAAGYFDRPVFPLLDSFRLCDPTPIFVGVQRFADLTSRFSRAEGFNAYSFDNDYFSSPDAEVAYALVRELSPRRIVEIGSGNSTLLFRAAIADGNLKTELVSIDPSPRRDIKRVADRILRKKLEEVGEEELVASLDSGDILFIDSSHVIAAANDVVTLLLRIIPALKVGVVIHLHDIFLPFEYPREWLVQLGWRWNEQYLVQALLQDSQALEVIWPGHYLQRTSKDFLACFDVRGIRRASSLWLRKTE